MHRWCRDATGPAFGTVWFLYMRGGAKKATARLEEFNKKFSDATLHKFLGPSQFSRHGRRGGVTGDVRNSLILCKDKQTFRTCKIFARKWHGCVQNVEKVGLFSVVFPGFLWFMLFLPLFRPEWIHRTRSRQGFVFCVFRGGGKHSSTPPLSEHYTLLSPLP